VSFSFRGNDRVREAIHTVFLYHAIQAGMDMGIVNAGQLGVYADLDPELRERVEDVVLNRFKEKDGKTPTERLLDIADQFKGGGAKQVENLVWREALVRERLTHALVHGITTFIEGDTEELRAEIKKYASFFEFDPIAPIMFYRGGWERYDTLGSLYSVAEDCRAFTPAELDCYDHLFCGSHIDLVADKLGEYSEQVLASHQMAKDGNYKNLKGIWRLQEQFFKTLAPK
jgi:hypothetical protein